MEIEKETVLKFNPFANFNDEQYEFIKQNAKLITVPPRKVLLKLGADHNNMFFLLKGNLKLVAADGKKMVMNEETPSAKNPIAQLRPSRYEVSSDSEVDLLVMSELIMNQAIEMQQAGDEEKSADSVTEDDSDHDQLLFDFLSLLHTNQLKLPSLPDIALKIRHAVEDENSDADDIIKIISMDQSILAKILKTANSAMYNTSGNKVDTIKNAYVRLGAKNVVSLVISYTMKEIFNSDSKEIQQQMKDLWQHSVKVAAISKIFAKLTPGMDSDKALLAGLIHNIGSVVLLNNLDDKLKPLMESGKLHNVLFSLQAEVGSNLLATWDFPDDIITVVENAGDWHRNEEPNADLADVVNIAQLHAYIATDYQDLLPNIDEVPAFKKIANGELTPEMSMQVLEASQEQIKETISLFT